MCIAIYKPAGKVIDKETLYRCYLKNKDGCGFSYFTSEGELIIMKSMSFDGFYEDYELHSVVNHHRPFLIHFRIATHGTVDLYNCHPFKIDDTHVMIHNGIIHNIRKCPDKLRSDTQMFVDDILKELPHNWMVNPGIKNLIEDYIGNSKVVVLAANDTVTIYNQDKGEWSNEVWYSNNGYKEIKTSKYYHREEYNVYNYERPEMDVNGNKIGTLYGRWEYDLFLRKQTWIPAERPEKKVTASTPNSIWSFEKKGWVLPTEWKYDAATGMMMEYDINGEFTGDQYPAGYRTKQIELRKQKELKYECCCSCTQNFETSKLYVVDEFRDADDCYLCKDCLFEFTSQGMPMSNPTKLSDIKALEDINIDEFDFYSVKG